MKPTLCDAMGNRSTTEPQRRELPQGDRALLSLSDFGGPEVT